MGIRGGAPEGHVGPRDNPLLVIPGREDPEARAPMTVVRECASPRAPQASAPIPTLIALLSPPVGPCPVQPLRLYSPSQEIHSGQ